MQLLGCLPLQRDRRHGDRSDPREREQVRGGKHLDLRLGLAAYPHVEREGLEGTPAERRRDTETVAPAEPVPGGASTFDGESEEVVRGGLDERVEESLFFGPPLDVHVSGRPRPPCQPQVEREPSLEQPVPWGRGEETRQKALEDDPLPVPRKTSAVALGPSLQPLLESLAERGRIPRYLTLAPRPVRSPLTRAHEPTAPTLPPAGAAES